MVYLDHQKLAKCMSEVLGQRGVIGEAIEHVVTSLVSTSLRGTDSHGINLVSALLQSYRLWPN